MKERKKKFNTSSLNDSLLNILAPYYVDYVGLANLNAYQTELVKFGGNVVKGYKSRISIGLVIPSSIVGFLPERADINVSCEYRIHG